MLTFNELTLTSSLSLGKLETNAEQLKELVLNKLSEYTPENYVGKIVEAKNDRAVLNNAEKMLNSKRLELEKEYMQPFLVFKNTIAQTCTAIKQASAKLDEIVKAQENSEKEIKRVKISEYWNRKNFTLFNLDKIFNEKWLNKSTKIKDIENEIDAKIKQTFDDLKVLDNFPEEDRALLKTIYLQTLNLSDATAKAQELKANRDRLAFEKKEGAEFEKQSQLRQQLKNEVQEVNQIEAEKKNSSLIAQALEITPDAPKVEDYALLFHGTRDQLLELKRYMTKEGITYQKLKDNGGGIYQL